MSKTKPIVIATVSGAIAGLLLNACALPPAADAIAVLHEAAYCAGGKGRQAQLLSDPATLAETWRQANNGLTPLPPPAVDFSRNSVLFLADAEHPTAGYGLRLSSTTVSFKDGVARLLIETTVPEGMSAQVVTRPCLFLFMPMNDYRRIEVVDRAGIPWIVLQRP